MSLTTIIEAIQRGEVTQSAIARATATAGGRALTQQAVSLIVRGKVSPTPATVERLWSGYQSIKPRRGRRAAK